jgi:hypothetical protein
MNIGTPNLKKRNPLTLAVKGFQPKYYDFKTPGLIKMCFIDNQWRIFMKQQVIEDVNIPHCIRVKNLR